MTHGVPDLKKISWKGKIFSFSNRRKQFSKGTIKTWIIQLNYHQRLRWLAESVLLTYTSPIDTALLTLQDINETIWIYPFYFIIQEFKGIQFWNPVYFTFTYSLTKFQLRCLPKKSECLFRKCICIEFFVFDSYVLHIKQQ